MIALRRYARLLAACAFLASLVTLAPPASAQQKRVYIANDDHTDYMWTADEAAYRQAFLDMIDYYLDLADTTASEAAPYQSRWNCDGSFWVWTYEHNRTAAQLDRLIGRIRDGHVSVPKNVLAIVYGGTPAEAVLRSMYYAGRLERRYGLDLPLAYAMEDQTLPWGLSSLWAGSGVRYSWKGICACASQVEDAWDRQHDIYWYTGPDGARVLMKWNSMLNGNQSMGGYAEARDPAAVVDFVTDGAPFNGFAARYPYPVIGCFGKGWDDLQTLTPEFVSVAKAKTNASRQVIVSNESDFFDDFAPLYGAGLARESVSYGNEWELGAASIAEVSASVKRSVEKLRAAEAMATLVALVQPSFLDGRNAARDLAFLDMGLYWEHCWSGGPGVSDAQRNAWQRKLRDEIAAYVYPLHDDAAAALAGMIAKTGGAVRFYAFNPLGWTRSEMAEIPYADTNPFHVVELASGAEVASQVVTVSGQRRLRVMADGVPPLGYKVYEVRPGAGTAFPAAATVTGGVLENALYRITLANRGAITSLLDKTRANREFASTIGGLALNDLGAGSGTLATENAGPVSVTLRADATGPLAHTTRVTLYRGSARIEIENRITQNFTDVRTWTYSFALSPPTVWQEEVGAVMKARLASDGGRYATRDARYDWLTTNHFADIGTAGVGMTVSTPDTFYMRLGASTPDVLDVTTPQLRLLAGGQVDGPAFGITSQGGDSAFLQRFALVPHDAWDQERAMRAALEHQNPFVARVVTGGGAYPETWYALATVSGAGVVPWAVKPADDGIGSGLVVRVWNQGPAPATAGLAFAPGSIAAATRTTHVETALEALPAGGGVLALPVRAQQIATVRVQLDPGAPLAGPYLFAERGAGNAVTLRWTFGGAPSYTLLRSTTPQFANPATVFSGAGVEAGDAPAVPAGTAVFYRVD